MPKDIKDVCDLMRTNCAELGWPTGRVILTKPKGLTYTWYMIGNYVRQSFHANDNRAHP